MSFFGMAYVPYSNFWSLLIVKYIVCGFHSSWCHHLGDSICEELKNGMMQRCWFNDEGATQVLHVFHKSWRVRQCFVGCSLYIRIWKYWRLEKCHPFKLASLKSFYLLLILHLVFHILLVVLWCGWLLWSKLVVFRGVFYSYIKHSSPPLLVEVSRKVST